MADFTFVEPIQEVKVSDLPAAYMKAKYTVGTAGGDELNCLGGGRSQRF